ncbi:hypothetical protein Tco_0346540, partial [Tanacetum coccineum]
NTGQAYTAGNSDRKSYARPKPLCSKCNSNHEGPCPLERISKKRTKKRSQKRQNRTRNGKAWRRHSQIQAQV